MKYCPKCETKYDDETIRFCTKDGSPLVAQEEPKFIEMPSEGLEDPETDDPSELTVIRHNLTPPPPAQPPPASSLDDITFDANDNPPAPRIIVPTTEEPVVFPPPRSSRPPQAYVQPQRSNTAIVVLLTIIGTVVVLGGAGLLFWLLQRDHSANLNTNLNANLQNVNLGINNNLNIDSNFNFNTNFNVNANVNANTKTPTPTPKPSPSPSPTESPDNSNAAFPNSNIRLPVNSMTTPTMTPRPTLTPPGNRSVNGGILNGRALNLAVPTYPQLAKQVHATGQVMVEVAVDESGRVVSAKAVSGSPLLRSAAEAAARQSRIMPSRINNENVRTTGLLVYNFKDN
jgi:TonB family protein